jgi:peptide/nickel transport system permease protein
MGATTTSLVVLMLALALLAPVLWGERAAAIDTAAILQNPSAEHLLGTDGLGRDIFYRVLVATGLSIGLALLASAIGVVLGTVLGSAPSVLPRPAAKVVISIVNIMVAFPGLLLALFFAVVFGVGTTGAVLAIGLATGPSFARLAQTLAASVEGRDFVSAARVAGVGRLRLLTRHILPNIAEPLVVNATINAGGALLAFAGLSFLGIGVQAPAYDWGRLLGEGLNRIYTNPASALAPGVAVVVAGLAFNLFGETIAAVVGQRATTVRLTPQAASVALLPPEPRLTDSDAAGQEIAHSGASPAADVPGADAVLRVEDLRVSFPTPQGWTNPLRGITFSIAPGESVGVVGESGSGKSLTALAAARLIESPAVVTATRIDVDGTPLLLTPERQTRHLLGTSLAMVFQDPTTSFNPTRRIGGQLAEVSVQHQGLGRRQALARAVDRLRAVRVPAPERRARQYPHEFSGGMRQRAMIGMGLMGSPRLIIADEPTTALDVTVQRQVLRLLATVRRETDAAILLITHDITVVGQVCERILVMYAGRIVEDLPVAALHTSTRHPYTRALISAVPDLDTDREQPLVVIPGRPPEPDNVPPGCPFAPRCPRATDQCRRVDPELMPMGWAHRAACWHPVMEEAGMPQPVTGGQFARE